MSRRTLLTIGCVVLLLGGAAWLRWLARGPGGTDQQQILAQIQRSESAAEMRDAGALLRVVSPDYKDDVGLTRPALRYQVARELREAQSLEVTIPANQIKIAIEPSGREAISTGP